MNVRNCKKCGKMFNYVAGPPLCQGCRDAIEQKFQEVKEYVRQNKVASMKDIAQDCHVEERQIEQWIREERLIFASDSPIKLYCETCGAPIFTGRYCGKCKNDQASSLGAAGRKPESAPPPAPAGSSSARMYSRK
ncbi:MAG: flagellar protein [Lachnospiraceae bacterium]|nr:flagellar protein [Lachnospiraceae bacterium]